MSSDDEHDEHDEHDDRIARLNELVDLTPEPYKVFAEFGIEWLRVAHRTAVAMERVATQLEKTANKVDDISYTLRTHGFCNYEGPY